MHPVTLTPLADVALSREALLTQATVTTALRCLRSTIEADPARCADEISPTQRTALWDELLLWATVAVKTRRVGPGGIQRFFFIWGGVLFLRTCSHGYVRRRRARSISKRRVKRLVRMSGYRF